MNSSNRHGRRTAIVHDKLTGQTMRQQSKTRFCIRYKSRKYIYFYRSNIRVRHLVTIYCTVKISILLCLICVGINIYFFVLNVNLLPKLIFLKFFCLYLFSSEHTTIKKKAEIYFIIINTRDNLPSYNVIIIFICTHDFHSVRIIIILSTFLKEI